MATDMAAQLAGLTPQQRQELYRMTPLAPPPVGQTSNFVDPPNRSALVISVIVVCLSVTTPFVALRAYTKWRLNKTGLRLEDYACISAFLIFIVPCGLVFKELENGAGRHAWDVNLAQAMTFAKLSIPLEVTYLAVLFLAKWSLLLSYLKIFGPVRRTLTWWACHITILFNLFFYIAAIIVIIFSCIPRAKIWDPTIQGGHCVDQLALLLATSALNLATDVATILIPMIGVWRLQMSTRRKRGVTAILATGFFGVICSLMRLVVTVSLTHSTDPTFHGIDQSLWSTGEICSAIVTGCMLSVPQFVKAHFPNVIASIRTRTRSSNRSKSQSVPRSRDASYPDATQGGHSKHWMHPAAQHKRLHSDVDAAASGTPKYEQSVTITDEPFELEKSPRDASSDAERTAHSYA